MSDSFKEGGLDIPEVEKKVVIPNWSADDLSPWGTLGDQFNEAGQDAIERGLVMFNEECGVYELTLKGVVAQKALADCTSLRSSYQKAMRGVSKDSRDNKRR